MTEQIVDQLSDFAQGVLYAAAIVQAMAQQPVIAADILREAGLTTADCADLDEYDKQHLRIVNEECGINLKNLE